jgi:predicted Zn finger-like uncharacterized protein
MVSDSLTDAGYGRRRAHFCRESPMLIICPNCTTAYWVETAALGTGRLVRCVRCRNVWFARDPAGLIAIAESHRSDLEELAGVPIAVTALGEAMPEAPAEAAEGGAVADMERPGDDLLPYALEPITIADAPTLVPMDEAAELPADAALGDGIAPFTRRRTPRLAGHRLRWSLPVRWSLPGLPVIVLVLIALNSALIGWRADVVRLLPQTASLYAAIGLPVNLRGLTFSNVTTTAEMHDGVQVLVVEGTIVSASQRAVEVPRLRFSVRNSSGHEVYAWTALPERSVLAPGTTLAFRSRLASPPADLREVLVRFFNRRDLAAGG